MKKNVFLTLLLIPFLVGGIAIGTWTAENKYEKLLSEQNASFQTEKQAMQEDLRVEEGKTRYYEKLTNLTLVEIGGVD